MSAGLLDQQCALIVGHEFVHMLVILDGSLLLRFGHAGFMPGERGERTAGHLRHNTDITALLAFHGLTQLNGGSNCRDK